MCVVCWAGGAEGCVRGKQARASWAGRGAEGGRRRPGRGASL